MAGIITLVIAFVVAVIGFVQSNRARNATKFFGLTKIGAVLVSLSAIGLAFGIYNQIQQARTINNIAEAVGGAADNLEQSNPATASALRIVQGALDSRSTEIEPSSFRQSILTAADFSSSRVDKSLFIAADLSASDFSWARFRNAVFHSADFSGADFTGVDLSKIAFDETTVFPELP